MDASYVQSSFLGGEISKWAQGQFENPRFKKALSLAQNILLVDEGAAPRRPGFQFQGTTRKGKAGRIIPFDFAEASPYNMEFTDGFLRLWNGTSLVTTNDSLVVSSISNTSPAVFTLSNTVIWQTGDEVYFNFEDPGQAVIGAVLLNRQFTITMTTPSNFSIVDSVTGVAVNGSDFGTPTIVSGTFDGPIASGPVGDGALTGDPVSRQVGAFFTLAPTVHHVAEIATPYSVAKGDWHSLRSIQGLLGAQGLSVLLQGSVAPQALQVLTAPADNEFATFAFSKAQFVDGPYLDPPANAIASISGQSGAIQVTVGYAAWVSTTVYGYGVPVTYSGQDYISIQNNNSNNIPSASSSAFWQALPAGGMISANGFVATDVGRMMRLFSAPQAWSSLTTYAAGNTAQYNGSYFTALGSTTNDQPDISTTKWVLNPSGALYSWGTIIQVLSANSVQLQLQGANLLYTTPCPSFRIGAWSDTTGWPKCGCYQGGRIWFSGAIKNRVDSSQPNAPFNMAPTLQDGTVTDSSGISYTFNSNSVDDIFWMEPQPQGILCGTQKGEYLLSSGTNGGPITPSSISESPATKYGSSNILPVKTGMTLCFIQRYGRRLLEYLADVFSQRFYGPDLTTWVRHLGTREFQELAYQQEPTPVVWARMADGSLLGTTYRRFSLFSNQEPEFNAWHQHPLGSGRVVESICVGPANDATFVGSLVDTLSLVTNDPATGIRYIESLTTLNDENDPLYQSFFVDCGVTPPAATIINYAPSGGTVAQNFVRFYGLSHLNGREVSVFAAALDCGDYIVTNGYVDVPLGKADSITGYTFDIPQFKLVQRFASEFPEHAVTITGGSENYTIPCAVGFNYQTKGQLCRPMLPVDTGAKNGPGFAKLRRSARYGINLVNSLGVQVGVDVRKPYDVNTKTPTGKQLPYLSTYSGIVRDTLNDDNSFDSMLYWQTTRPYPATVVNFGGFIVTEDV